MLPAVHRMRLSSDFEAAVRRGRRAGRRTVVAHATRRDADEPARVGFVVSRAVGSAVVRNRVKRRLRAVMAVRVRRLPPGSLLVVRANPASAGVTAGVLAADVDAVLASVLGGRGRARETSAGSDGGGS